MTQLTANFSLHELTKSETALRMGFDNTPGDQEIAALTLLAQKVLQPVRDHYGKGVKVNSGYRSPEVTPEVCLKMLSKALAEACEKLSPSLRLSFGHLLMLGLALVNESVNLS